MADISEVTYKDLTNLEEKLRKDLLAKETHEEFVKRMDIVNEQQTNRIDAMEAILSKINDLTLSINNLAIEIGDLCDNQKSQGERLTKIEGRDGEKWRSVVSYVGLAIVGAIVAFILSYIGLK